MSEAKKVSSGVQELIGRLRDDGVQAGREEAETLVREAKAKVQDIIDKAKTESREIRDRTFKDIELEKTAAREALQLAVRDTILDLKSSIRARFADQVKRVVSLELEDQDFLRQLILAIAGEVGSRTADKSPMEILLSDTAFPEEITQSKEASNAKDRTRHMILSITREMLREGIELKPAGKDISGIRIRIVDEDLEIDLTDECVSKLLLKHLIPRFREVLEGIDG